MNKNKGLGRGFESLIPKQSIDQLQKETGEKILEINIADIVENPYQPRRVFDYEKLLGLKESIQKNGLLQPIIVIKANDGKFQLIAGERRYRAVQLLGHKKIPAIVRTMEQQQQLEVALIENVQREDLGILDLAVAFRRLVDEFSITQDEIGSTVGRSGKSVGNIMRLLDLPDFAKEALQASTITEGHARQVLSIKDPERQKYLIELIVKNEWSVRQTEAFVKKFKNPLVEARTAFQRLAISTKATRVLEKKLGAKVRVKHLANSSKLVIECKDEQELEKIMSSLL